MKKRLVSILIAISLLFTFSFEVANAALTKAAAPKEVTSFKSSYNFEDELLSAEVKGKSVLKISFNTPIKTEYFYVSLYKVEGISGNCDSGLSMYKEAMVSGDMDNPIYGFDLSIDLKKHNVEDGYYNLYIQRRDSMDDLTIDTWQDRRVAYKNLEIRVKKGNVKILRYKSVKDYNKKVKGWAKEYKLEKYLDNTLEDIRFILRDPAKDTYDTIDIYKQKYIKGISDEICNGISSDYLKIKAIYEYTASNFYYDTIAFRDHALQYANPYDNIYNYEHKRSSANSQNGIVYTTCQGFSGIFLSLARAQNIPTRFVYGHRLSIPYNDWRIERNISVKDHWWVEAYVDGRWIFVDPTIGSENRYDKERDIAVYTGLTNYTYFDPSLDQIATSHVYINIYPDYRYGRYIANEDEISKLGAFLSYNENGKLMNKEYIEEDHNTWGDGIMYDFKVDSDGNTLQIQWCDFQLEGNLDLSGFKKLTKVELTGNELTTFDAKGSKKLESANLRFNPLKSATLYMNGKDRYITAVGDYTFSFKYNKSKSKSLTIYTEPEIGYKTIVRNALTGKVLSEKKTYTLKPLAESYTVETALDSESYKYTIKKDTELTETKLNYLKAAIKRLNELGYYAGYSNIDDVKEYTDELVMVVSKFQEDNGLTITGNVGKSTWKLLFTETEENDGSEGILFE